MAAKIIQQGAEARIFLDKNKIIKCRTPKSYRLPNLDEKIRKTRTKTETKLLEKASKIIGAPVPFSQKQNKENYKITMSFIKGKRLSENLNNFPLKKQKEICSQIGISIAKLHDSGIIHGDLTTSNMILVEDIENNFKPKDNGLNKREKGYVGLKVKNQCSALTKSGTERLTVSKTSPLKRGNLGSYGFKDKNFRIFLIDFGLGFHSTKMEDKAVDLHLLKQALEAKHFLNWISLFDSVFKGYKISENYDKVVAQFKKVEARGRYKEQY